MRLFRRDGQRAQPGAAFFAAAMTARVERLLGVDLDDPDIRVSLLVALMADEIARQAG